MGLRAVIFDFDGVVADDERLHMAGFRHALAAHGIELSEAVYFERYLGFDDRDGFHAMLRDNGRDADDATVVELMREKGRVFRDLVRERVQIFPGVRELLASLREGEDPLPIAIGSGALGSEIRLILGIAGLEPFFDGIVAADDVSVGKPDPETFLRACELLATRSPGLQPEHCLVIEDSAGGLAAGRAAGMTTVGVANSYPASDLVADLVVESLEELDRARCEALFES
jgi:beta-phosphoglucomutase